MNRFKCFYKNRKPVEIEAETSYEAQKKAKAVFQERNSRDARARGPSVEVWEWDVTVVLIEKMGQPVTHSTAEFG